MEGRLMDRRVIQPDDMLVVVRQLRVVVIVFVRMMRRQMSVRGRMWMIRVGFVDVSRSERQQRGDVRQKDQADDRPPG
jgi:hypothetical protein